MHELEDHARGRAQAGIEPRHVAVIDLGSNSWRLVVYSYERRRAGAVVEADRRALRVGADRRAAWRATGALSDDAMDTRPRDAGDLRALLPRQRPRATRTCTCSPPARSATPATASRSSSACGRRPATRSRCSPPTRRRTTATWPRSTARRSRDGVVLDIGGGSMQLIRVEGPARAGEHLVPDRRRADDRGVPGGRRSRSPGAQEGSAAPARPSLRAARQRPVGCAGHGGRLVGTGGAVRNLAAAAQRAAVRLLRRHRHRRPGVRRHAPRRSIELVDTLSRAARRRAARRSRDQARTRRHHPCRRRDAADGRRDRRVQRASR